MKKLSMVGGLMVSWIIDPLSMGGALTGIGIPKASINQYENALRTNKFILIVQGSLQEVEKATNILRRNKAEYANYHKVVIGKHSELA
jgi:hypothetical protein